jgi:hypothetical protein
MPITVTNPFKGRQYPGDVILLAVWWYLRYPLAYEHVSELLAERGLEADASCVWRWVQVYSPELNKRCQPHLKRTNKSYRVDDDNSRLGHFFLHLLQTGLRSTDPLLLGMQIEGQSGCVMTIRSFSLQIKLLNYAGRCVILSCPSKVPIDQHVPAG